MKSDAFNLINPNWINMQCGLCSVKFLGKIQKLLQ